MAVLLFFLRRFIRRWFIIYAPVRVDVSFRRIGKSYWILLWASRERKLFYISDLFFRIKPTPYRLYHESRKNDLEKKFFPPLRAPLRTALLRPEKGFPCNQKYGRYLSNPIRTRFTSLSEVSIKYFYLYKDWFLELPFIFFCNYILHVYQF